jgi:hypothetical protein
VPPSYGESGCKGIISANHAACCGDCIARRTGPSMVARMRHLLSVSEGDLPMGNYMFREPVEVLTRSSDIGAKLMNGKGSFWCRLSSSASLFVQIPE